MAVTDGELIDPDGEAAFDVVRDSAGRALALRRGGSRMAQFSHADFGGMSQSSPGRSMVGDMFNTQLKAKLDALCIDIAAHLDLSENR
jgi:hypothetical protein